MKYIVIDKLTGNQAGKPNPNSDLDSRHMDYSNQCIVTQDGLVAWWDEGQGWSIDDNQDGYEIKMLDNQ